MKSNQFIDEMQAFEDEYLIKDGRLSGKFFTPEVVGKHLVKQAVQQFLESYVKTEEISICDPFCGDGRLIKLLIKELRDNGISTKIKATLIDSDSSNISESKANLSKIGENNIEFKFKRKDSFVHYGLKNSEVYDIVITNPPWAMLKIDQKHIVESAEEEHVLQYKTRLKEYSHLLLSTYPLSKPKGGFASLGTNLARLGVELGLKVCSTTGIVAFVSPASLLADTRSKPLRKWMFDKYSCSFMNYYPAEARLFERVDQPFITAVFSCRAATKCKVQKYDKDLNLLSDFSIAITKDFLDSLNWAFPVQYNKDQITVLTKIISSAGTRQISELENESFWIGRELDETRYKQRLVDSGDVKFIKGKSITRMHPKVVEMGLMNSDELKLPGSTQYSRIVWRDVSRPSQKRRVHATIISPGFLTGNSLNVLHNHTEKRESLLSLLGLISSLVFEFNMRSMLATNHISASTFRSGVIPNFEHENNKLNNLVLEVLDGKTDKEYDLEIMVAKLYGLTKKEFQSVIEGFDKLTENEKNELLSDKRWAVEI